MCSYLIFNIYQIPISCSRFSLQTDSNSVRSYHRKSILSLKSCTAASSALQLAVAELLTDLSLQALAVFFISANEQSMRSHTVSACLVLAALTLPLLCSLFAMLTALLVSFGFFGRMNFHVFSFFLFSFFFLAVVVAAVEDSVLQKLVALVAEGFVFTIPLHRLWRCC